MFYGLKTGSADIPSGPLHYMSFGKGRKNLIMIQGLNVRDLGGAEASLAVMYRIFAKDYRVYLFDRRAVVKEGLTIRDLADDIYFAMRELKIGSAAVCGVSQGGMIALTLTLEHPECVDKLVLGVSASRMNETLKTAVLKWADSARRRDYITINRDTFTMMYSEQYIKKNRLMMPLAVRLVKPEDPERFALLALSMLGFDCYGRLDEIKCPVLVLGADKDMVTTGEASREIAEKLGCEIHMYHEYGHAAYEEEKDFNRRIYDFLQS